MSLRTSSYVSYEMRNDSSNATTIYEIVDEKESAFSLWGAASCARSRSAFLFAICIIVATLLHFMSLVFTMIRFLDASTLIALGRIGFFFPLFVCVYCESIAVHETNDTMRWTVVGRPLASAMAIALLVFMGQLLERLSQQTFPFDDDDDDTSTVVSLRSMASSRRPDRRGYTTIPLVLSLVLLSLGLFMPVARVSTSRTVAFATINGTALAVFLVRGLCVVLPLMRASFALVAWFLPMNTSARKVSELFMAFASSIVCHDILAFIFLISANDMARFIETTFSLEPWVAPLLFGVITEHLTSTWIRYRLRCEIRRATKPDAPLISFATYLRGGHDDSSPHPCFHSLLHWTDPPTTITNNKPPTAPGSSCTAGGAGRVFHHEAPQESFHLLPPPKDDGSSSF